MTVRNHQFLRYMIIKADPTYRHQQDGVENSREEESQIGKVNEDERAVQMTFRPKI